MLHNLSSGEIIFQSVNGQSIKLPLARTRDKISYYETKHLNSVTNLWSILNKKGGGGSSSASTPRSMIGYSILLAHALRPRTFHSSAAFPGVTTKHPGCLWMEIDGVFRRIAVLLKRISLSPVMLRCTGCRLRSNTVNAPIELSSNFFPFPPILTKTDSRRLHSVVRWRHVMSTTHGLMRKT